jgi:hypothetical protein
VPRSFTGHSGTCDGCGCFGRLWVEGGAPQLCDGCEAVRTVRQAYADDPALARRVYGADTPESALALLRREGLA